ncbi:MAG: hypothetical protein KAW89_05705 [Armatimonadetes bacterium]|nr:hypothetical protein [Armatimonadota bacterium]
MNSDNAQQMGEMELGHLCEKLHAALHYERIEEAEKIACKLMEIAPRSTTSWELWGDVLLAQDKIEEASDAFKKAVELEPANADAERKYASIQLDLQQAKWERQVLESGDLSQFRGAVNKEPGTAAARSALFPGLGQVYNGEYEKGLIMFCVGLALLTGAVRLVVTWLSPGQSLGGLGAVWGYIGLFGGMVLYIFGVYDAYRGSQEEQDRPLVPPPTELQDKGE